VACLATVESSVTISWLPDNLLLQENSITATTAVAAIILFLLTFIVKFYGKLS